VAYQQLPIQTVPLDDLSLDLDNFRTGRQESQAAAMEDLFLPQRKTMQIARSILTTGYLDNEVPLVVQEGASFVVLEGNERVCALKVLRDPRLVPSQRRQLDDLLLRYHDEAQNLPDAIRVQVCPNRDFAVPHIARLHTGDAKDAWDLDSQARFVRVQLERPGMTANKLRDLIPKATRFIMMAEMRRLLEVWRFSNPSLKEFAVGPKLTLSSLEYAYKRKDIKNALGIAFTKDGFLSAVPETAAQKRALERLVWWFKEKKLNTRSPQLRNGTVENKAFIADLLGLRLTPSSTGGSANSATQGGGIAVDGQPLAPPSGAQSNQSARHSSTPSEANAVPITRGSNLQSTQATLDVTGIYDEGVLTGNFKDRLRELRSIDVQRYPASSSMLLRSVVEEAVRDHYRRKRKPFPHKARLESMVQRMQHDYNSEGEVVRAVNRLRLPAADQKVGSLDWFNTISHTVDVTVVGKDVHEAWGELQSLVRFMLRPLP
jgi:hypothetical protein